MKNPLRKETLREKIATIIQAASKTTKPAHEVAGEVMAAVKADKQRRARK